MTEQTNGTQRAGLLAGLQLRLENLEKKAEPAMTELLANGRGVYESVRLELQRAPLSSDLKKLASAGRKRLSGLVERAEAAGSLALDRVARFQVTAVGALGLATRSQVEDLTRTVKRLTKKAARAPRRRGVSDAQQA